MSTEYMMSIEVGGGEYGKGEVYSEPDELVYWCMKNGFFKLDGFEYTINLNPKEAWYIAGHEFDSLEELINGIRTLIKNHQALYELSYTDIGNALHSIKDTLDRVDLESAMSTAGWCYAMDFYNVDRDDEVDMSEVLTTYMGHMDMDIFTDWEKQCKQ